MYHLFHPLLSQQGPLPNTTADFWKMVWQEGSEVIVMTTSLFENGRKKSEKYWPDESHGRKYGPITVKCISEM